MTGSISLIERTGTCFAMPTTMYDWNSVREMAFSSVLPIGSAPAHNERAAASFTTISRDSVSRSGIRPLTIGMPRTP
jgi:hypothetical protein